MANTVITYKSTDASAPVLTGQVGSLIALLDACLVNGYGAKAAAGWTKPFSGTNKAAYQGSAVNNSARFYLRVLDDGTTTGGALEAGARGYETMSDVDTGTGEFPTVAQAALGYCIRKSATANATARAWTVIADDRGFYLQISHGSTLITTTTTYFGWFPSNKASDAYNCCFAGEPTFNNANSVSGLSNLGILNSMTAVIGLSIARSYSQVGGAILGRLVGLIPNAAAIGAAGYSTFIYPNGPDNALWVFPVFIGEGANSIRGKLPGAYTHLHSTFPFNNYDTATNIVGLSGITLISLDAKNSSSAGQILIDITGPWS